MQEFFSNINWEHLLRLLVAAILGTLVGLEREYRAKGAGYRTHFMVCLGSALMMLVSQYGFEEILGKYAGTGSMRLDPARIAAQVVSGIGFLGAGTIILQKQMVKGLTTAAGLWAIAGVGLAAGAGLYKMAIVATILILFGMELLRVFFKGLGYRSVGLEFTIPDKENLSSVQSIFAEQKFSVSNYSVTEVPSGYKVDVVVRLKNKSDETELFRRLNEIKELTMMKLD